MSRTHADLNQRRRKVQEETLAIVQAGRYAVDGRTVSLPVEEMFAGVEGAYVFTELVPQEAEPGGPLDRAQRAGEARCHPDTDIFARETLASGLWGGTSVEVLQEDTLVAGLHEAQRGLHTAVLNFANQYTPGGGWKHGSGAQEENLHRRSNLSDHLANPRRLTRRRDLQYPLPDFGGIFSNSVFVFRGPESEDYRLLPQPDLLSVITVAAYNSPPLVASGQEMDTSHTQGTRRKIDAMLGVAVKEGVQALVLGAFGCGAFRNPPRQMAMLFKEQLGPGGRYWGCFERVIFAIIDRPDRPDENCRIFRDVLFKQE